MSETGGPRPANGSLSSNGGSNGKVHRVVLTGGPGGGKTTAADLFRRELDAPVAVVPEAATILFAAGLPRSSEARVVREVQRAIFDLQRNLEEVQRALYPGHILLCDRGTLDGAAYWPEGPEAFFSALGTTFEDELARYDAVIFFETAAAGGIAIDSNNPHRNESLAQATDLDARLRALWSHHPRFIFVPHNRSFFKKITFGLASMESIVGQLVRGG